MSIWTTTEKNADAVIDGDRRSKGPYNERGQRVSKDCPACGCGKLQYEGHGIWRCDGLADPGRDHLPLEACTHGHEDGTPVRPV